MTCTNYISSVRMAYARLMLCSGESVQAVCRACGFENKRVLRITPHRYADQQKRLNA